MVTEVRSSRAKITVIPPNPLPAHVVFTHEGWIANGRPRTFKQAVWPEVSPAPGSPDIEPDIEKASELITGGAYFFPRIMDDDPDRVLRYKGVVRVSPVFSDVPVFEFSESTHHTSWCLPRTVRDMISLNDSVESLHNHEFLTHGQWLSDTRGRNISGITRKGVNVLRSMKLNLFRVPVGLTDYFYQGVVRYDVSTRSDIPEFMFSQQDTDQIHWFKPSDILPANRIYLDVN